MIERDPEKRQLSFVPTVLAIGNDIGCLGMLQRDLVGMNVTAVQDLAKADDLIVENRPHLIIVDADNLQMDVFGWLESNTVPFMVLDKKRSRRAVVGALDGRGAEDYVVKPFNMEEVQARIVAILARRQMVSEPKQAVRFITDDFEIDVDRLFVVKNGLYIRLTKVEWLLLKELLKNVNEVVPKSRMIASIREAGPGDNEVLRAHILDLRAKIEPDRHNPKYLLTVPRLGHVFRIPERFLQN